MILKENIRFYWTEVKVNQQEVKVGIIKKYSQKIFSKKIAESK